MDWQLSAVTYVAGAITVALVEQIVARVFGAPRIHVAIKNVGVSRTKHRAHISIPVSDTLRSLLSERPTKLIDWDSSFMSEHAMDLSILELIEREQNHFQFETNLRERRERLSELTVKDQVLSLGRNVPLIRACNNALIHFNERAPHVPSEPNSRSVVFPLVTKTGKSEDGMVLEFVHLDLPGNPFPVVGSREGRPETNVKTVALSYAMSYCDWQVLSDIYDLAADYCARVRTHARELRSCLENVKREKAFLEVTVSASNTGTLTAYVSPFAEVHLGKASSPVGLTCIGQSVSETNFPALIRDTARRLSDWAPSTRPDVQRYESAIEYVPVPTGAPTEIHFVTNEPVASVVTEAVTAMLTGYASCSLTIWQYVPRRLFVLPRAARFVRRIRTLQSISASRP